MIIATDTSFTLYTSYMCIYVNYYLLKIAFVAKNKIFDILFLLRYNLLNHDLVLYVLVMRNNMFIGREKELRDLNQLYIKNNFQFPVIYGRRRVGKTALINEFIKQKDTIFFTGLETNAKQNLENFSKAIFDYANGFDVAPVFSSFQEALEYVFALSQEKRIVLVIDEYPYIAKSYKGFASVLQVLIDKYKDTSKLDRKSVV